MRAAILVGTIVLLAAGSLAAQAPIAGDLPPVPVPDLSRAEETVQVQLHEHYMSLFWKRRSPQPSASDLGEEYGQLGKLLLAAEFRDAAIVALQNAETLEPTDRRWPYYLGHAYKANGDISAAREAFQRALRLAPDDVPTNIWLGEAALDRGQPEPATLFFTKARSLHPESVAAHYGLGRAALQRQEYDEAVKHFERALALDEKASIIHYSLGMAYRGLGDREQARAHLQQRGTGWVIPDDPLMKDLDHALHSVLTFEDRGTALLERGDWAEAAEFFRKGIELLARSPMKRAALYFKLGTALSYLDDRGGALEALEQAVRLAPNSARAQFALGVMQESVGRHRQAVRSYSAAVEAEPGHVDARLRLVAALVRLRRYSEAQRQLDRAMKLELSPAQAAFAGEAVTVIEAALFGPFAR